MSLDNIVLGEHFKSFPQPTSVYLRLPQPISAYLSFDSSKLKKENVKLQIRGVEYCETNCRKKTLIFTTGQHCSSAWN